MPCNLRYLTWEQFDEAIGSIPMPICDGFYALPRGGLPLAVALSHKFGKPLLARPTYKSILVDDIADSGTQIAKFRLEHGAIPAIVWVLKKRCTQKFITHAMYDETDDWIVFPWENKEKALEDYENYITNK